MIDLMKDKTFKDLLKRVDVMETVTKAIDPKVFKGLEDLARQFDPKKLGDLEKKQGETEKWFMSASQSTEQKLAGRIDALERKLGEIDARLKVLEGKDLKEMMSKQQEMFKMISELTKKYNETAKTVIQNIGR